jgi:osmotically-inducible protein OsmY
MMNDKALRQMIVDELDFDPSVNSANIGVAVHDGVVTLSGHVGSYTEKVSAEKIVRRVKGVRAIAQEIDVRYPADPKLSDDDIAARALNIIKWNTQLPPDALQVKVQKGYVTLSGKVDWQYQRISAENAVRKLSGVIGITNLIDITPHVTATDVRSKIIDALKRNAISEANSIQIKVADTKVTLEGRVHDWHEHDLVTQAAWSVPGVRTVDDKISVTAIF